MKWNHTRLPEDVQNQQRSQEMTMIHRVLIMNIIHVPAHGDTDEIRPSDMDKKNCCICWLSVLSILFVKCIYDYIFTYITQITFHLCWVILSIKLFWHDFHTTDYIQAHWQELPSALDSSSGLTFGRFHKYLYQSMYTGGILHATPQTDHII